MLLHSFINRTSAVVVALVVSISLPSRASTPVYAQLGLVSVGGSLTSGGTLNYKFDVEVSTNVGTLVVNASIIGKKFKANFPVLTITNPALGVTEDVPGTSVHIPTNFTGNAVVHVTAAFNKKKIGSQTLLVAITAPLPPAPLTVTTNLYDVGFENPVTLDGSIVPTSGMTGTLVYAWSQTSGDTVTLSTNASVTTGFTTGSLTNFVTMTGATNSLYYTNIEGVVTNQDYVEPEHRFGNINDVPLDNEQASAATYGFKLLVSDGSVTRTGLYTVACTVQTPAQPNIPAGVTAYIKAATNSTNWTLISLPAGSTATLTHTNSLIPQLRPDVPGVYIVQDNVTGTNVTLTAATWTGYQFCAICHGPVNNVGEEDIVTSWSQTLHATMAERGVDGQLSSHYNESCFQCHTVGFNQSPAATNGNFYAVQQQLGWPFPAVLQAGNYAAMPAALQNVANIQCENCHGPGSRHPGSPSVSLDVKVCSSCHQSGTEEVNVQQWEISPHAGGYESLSDAHNSGESCARCHSPNGFIGVAKGLVSAGVTNNAAGLTAVPMGAGPLTCQVCHDPHNAFGNPDRHQLRVYDVVALANPLFSSSPTINIGLGDSLTTANLQLTNSTVTVTNAGLSAACMFCHNAREWPTQIQISGTNTNKMYYQTTAPSMSTAGDIFAGLGGYDYGQTEGNSFHTYLASCQSCHMYTLRAPTVTGGVTSALDSVSIDGVVTPINTTALYNQFVNVLGSHTFEMTFQYTDSGGTNHVVQNIAACNQCHASLEPVTTFDYIAPNGQDYDGNGVIQGVQTETQGVLNNLGYLLQATGVSITTNAGNVTAISTSTGYSTNAVLQAAQRKAAWNWDLESHEGSVGVHNTQYTIRLLQNTYTDLSTNFYGDVTKTYKNAFPNAFLR